MSRLVSVVSLSLLLSLAALAIAADGASKKGAVKSVDAKAKTFVLDLTPNRDLTFTVNDKTAITLDGKESTFDAAIKPEAKASVSYTREGENRIATKVEVTSAKEKGAGQK